MEFTASLVGVENCNCLDSTAIDTTNLFTRRINTETPSMDDFRSYHEVGKRYSGDDCEKKCSFRGVSIYACLDKEVLIKHHKQTVLDRKKINPSIVIPENCMFFKFKESAGVVKQSGKDQTHHDFYKCNDFVLDSLTDIEVINLL